MPSTRLIPSNSCALSPPATAHETRSLHFQRSRHAAQAIFSYSKNDPNACMSDLLSPFLAVPPDEWVCSNELAFAIYDRFPVSRGHALITTRRIVETWFHASTAEKTALMALVDEAR